MATQRDVQRSFRLPASLDAELVAKAAMLDRSVSWVILRSLETTLLGEKRAYAEAVGRSIVRAGRSQSKRKSTKGRKSK